PPRLRWRERRWKALSPMWKSIWKRSRTKLLLPTCARKPNSFGDSQPWSANPSGKWILGGLFLIVIFGCEWRWPRERQSSSTEQESALCDERVLAGEVVPPRCKSTLTRLDRCSFPTTATQPGHAPARAKYRLPFPLDIPRNQ